MVATQKLPDFLKKPVIKEEPHTVEDIIEAAEALKGDDTPQIQVLQHYVRDVKGKTEKLLADDFHIQIADGKLEMFVARRLPDNNPYSLPEMVFKIRLNKESAKIVQAKINELLAS